MCAAFMCLEYLLRILASHLHSGGVPQTLMYFMNQSTSTELRLKTRGVTQQEASFPISLFNEGYFNTESCYSVWQYNHCWTITKHIHSSTVHKDNSGDFHFLLLCSLHFVSKYSNFISLNNFAVYMLHQCILVNKNYVYVKNLNNRSNKCLVVVPAQPMSELGPHFWQ